MTLGVLKPYRRLGVGTKLLEKVFEMIGKSKQKLDAVFLHVQVNNQVAMDFYKRHGFEQAELCENYYEESVQPRNAYIFQKTC